MQICMLGLGSAQAPSGEDTHAAGILGTEHDIKQMALNSAF